MSLVRKPNIRHCLVALAVALFILSPNIFRNWGYGLDFTDHMWLQWYQGQAIAHLGHPNLYLSATNVGVFEPYFAFYGGTLYTIFGTLSYLTGWKMFGFFLALFVNVIVAYRGVWFFARQVGVPAWLSHLPAFVFVTSAYFITDMYARGSWAELAALAAVPFFLAYALALLRAPWTTTRVLGFIFGTMMLTGSHNISLEWSAVLLIIFGIGTYIAAGPLRPTKKRAFSVLLLAAASTCINAWFLAIDLLHSQDTQIAHSAFTYEYTGTFNDVSNVLSPLRGTPSESTTFGLVIAAPVLAVAFGLLVANAKRRRSTETPAQRRLWWTSVFVGCATFVILTMGKTAWLKLGAPLNLIQFPYRISGWLAVASSVFLAMSLARRGAMKSVTGRWLSVAGVVLVVITIVQAAHQLYPHPPAAYGFTERNRNTAFAGGKTTAPPDTWYDPGNYQDWTLTQLPIDIKLTPGVKLPIPKPGVMSTSGIVTLPPAGQAVATNIAGGPWIVKVTGTGFHVAGRTPGGFIAIERDVNGPDQVKVTATAAPGAIATIGNIASVLAILGLLSFLRRTRKREKRGELRWADPLPTAEEAEAALAAARAARYAKDPPGDRIVIDLNPGTAKHTTMTAVSETGGVGTFITSVKMLTIVTLLGFVGRNKLLERKVKTLWGGFVIGDATQPPELPQTAPTPPTPDDSAN